MEIYYSQSQSRSITRSIIRWGRNNFQEYPWRNTNNHWLAIVAEVMLQRTKVSSVVPVWERFSRAYPDPDSVVDGHHELLQEVLYPLGLNWRNKLIRELAEALVNLTYIPDKKEELQKLPGIGDYSSSAILSLHMGRREVIIDANVVRWLSRMVGADYDGETRRKAWLRQLSDQLTPRTPYKSYNYGVLDFTMNVCANPPKCQKCPVSRHCSYFKKLSNNTVSVESSR